MRPGKILVIGSAILAMQCGGGSSLEPTPVQDPPALTCPGDVSVVAHNNQKPTVTFDAPIVTGGRPPVTITCTPASGTTFAIGPTPVGCEARDAGGRRSLCAFTVLVTAIPQLQKTTFLAFGDSLTEGKTSLRGPTIVNVPPGTFNTAVSYVEQLDRKLRERYQDQIITVIADGYGGEVTAAGLTRLRSDLVTFRPDAVLIWEGVNDLLKPNTFTPVGMQAAVNNTLSGLTAMVRESKSRGVHVFIATLTPLVKDANVTAGVTSLNAGIRALAAQEGATLVDLFVAVPPELIGPDGIHPRAQAYDTIAEEWMKNIIAMLEVKVQ